jgi:hypothetical protein
MSSAPNANEVRDLVTRWFRALDRHDALERVLPMLENEQLTMTFPEGTLHGHDGFSDWYKTVTNKFFDETHELRSFFVEPGEDGTVQVNLVVNWKASMWAPPAPDSDRLDFDATQTWTVGRSPDGELRIRTYVVDDLHQLPGSASL